ncbi:cytidine deaminase-like protein [Macroventuria anomochaeta]|uniref:Cytidine deaminase-like protein n=1 Tax=Macroventuria anomochaeta TaxID=301207 RepID=A0ACB6RPD4_9PLEO|nr:cytidine deaminase-like protein [Macroventuria anomochaeta]KAF2622792.1 cytidine deaminase-like protein [Macroventuria anomochaeta]
MSAQDTGFQAALHEARRGSSEGGVSIGAALGYNMRIQNGSATLHAEISARENAGHLPASAYQGATTYTSLSPCDMCTGACVMYNIKRVVIGQNISFVGGEEYLKSKGIEVVFIKEKPGDWYEDIGEDQ